MAFHLLPREEKFYAEFTALADQLVEGSAQLARMLDARVYEVAGVDPPLSPQQGTSVLNSGKSGRDPYFFRGTVPARFVTGTVPLRKKSKTHPRPLWHRP